MRLTLWFLLLLPALGGLATGCGGGDDDSDADGDADADADADGDADGDADLTENEPNSPNRPADIEIPTTITGRISAPVANAPDVDGFRFSAEAGTVVRLTLSGIDQLQPIVIVQSAQGTTPAIQRTISATTPGLTRQLFIPVTGDYDLFLGDVRNDGSGPLRGGDGYLYTLDIVTETVAPEPLTLPLDMEFEELPTDNGIRIYEIAPSERGFLIADIDAIIGHEPASDFDSALVLMNESLTALIAENDDEDPTTGNFDSLIRRVVTGETTVNLVVDFWGAGADNAHHLSVQVADLGTELEPDNGIVTAWPLSITADAEPLSPVNGSVAEPIVNPDDSETADFDYYDMGARDEGDALEVIVAPTEGSEIEPTVYVGVVVQTTFGPQFIVDWSSEQGADGVARVEATATQAGRYYAIVSDRRNIIPATADANFVLDAVGGETFGYAITANEWTRTVTPVTLPYADAGSLSQVGEIDWFEFTAEGEADEVTIHDGDVLIAHTTTDGWEASISLFDHTAFTPQQGDDIDPIVGFYAGFGKSAVVIPYVNDTDDAHVMEMALAVWNAGQWPGESASYDISIVSREPESSTAEDGDFGNDTHEAVVVESSIADFTGELTDDGDVDADVFTVRLEEGQTLIAAAYATDAQATTDTTLAISGGELEDPIENDDFGGSLYSQATYTVPEGGAGIFYVTMEPFCNQGQCAVGEYGLRIIVID